MVSEKATLVNPQGLHMRPAGLFASTMGKYACDVTVVTPEKEVNGKSPMALMAAGILCRRNPYRINPVGANHSGITKRHYRKCS